MGDATTIADAQAVLTRYGIADPAEIAWGLEQIRGKPGDPNLSRSSFEVVVRPADALAAAARFLEDQGHEPRILDAEATGEARDVARRHAEVALLARQEERPIALLSGGELTVTVTGGGTGGPNQELCARARAGDCRRSGDRSPRGGRIRTALTAIATWPAPSWTATPSTTSMMQASTRSRRLPTMMRGGALGEIGALFVPGPTQTNVSDLRIILVDPRA